MNLAYWDFFELLNANLAKNTTKTNVPFYFIGESANGEFYTNKMAHLAAICKKQLDEQST